MNSLIKMGQSHLLLHPCKEKNKMVAKYDC